ncbi:CHAP domain-containing protein, partial [Staphylococcus pseudintermedius]
YDLLLPKTGNPAPEQVADWALALAGVGVDVDGYYRRQ